MYWPPGKNPLAIPHTSDSPWLQVLGGVAFDLVNPRAELVDFNTVARVLSRVARFGGHTERGTLSVAQHCLEGSEAILRDHGDRLAAAAFLIHDAHEAYIGDMPTPVRDALCACADELLNWDGRNPVRGAIKLLKERLDGAIYPAAGLPWPLPQVVSARVSEYDERMCNTERLARLAPSPRPWPMFDDLAPVAGVDTHAWSEGTIRSLYVNACRMLLPTCGGSL